MRKRFHALTEGQKQRGVIFSSQLMPDGCLHEVLKDNEDKEQTIKRLKDDSFFNGSPYRYNLIRE